MYLIGHPARGLMEHETREAALADLIERGVWEDEAQRALDIAATGAFMSVATVIGYVEVRYSNAFAASRMMQYGGGFASALATAWFRADSGNRARIEKAFADLFAKYQDDYFREE
jgi:hypothetical protein